MFYLILCVFSVWSFVGRAGSFSEMTLEEKIGQLLIVHFHEEEELQTLLETVHIGGVIYYAWANDLSSPEKVRNLSARLQERALKTPLAIPLLIAADQEGGIVSRLSSGFTRFPGNLALGETGDPKLAEQCAYVMGQEMRSVGVNFNLAPVVDINTEPRNPVIGIRSFGKTSERVVAFGEQALLGYKKACVLTSLKHFPGHGDTHLNSHDDLPFIYKSQEELEKNEWVPFQELSSLTDSIMTAHVMLPKIDPVYCATLSRKILRCLRSVCHFEGVIISDSLVMQGLLKNVSSIDEAAVLAFNAGCDLLLLGGRQLIDSCRDFELKVEDIQRIHRRLVEAVREGRISLARLEEALGRICKLKKRYPLLPDPKRDNETLDPSSVALAATVAEKAIQVEGEHFSLKGRSWAVIAPHSLKQALEGQEGLFFSESSPTPEERQEALLLRDTKEALVVFAHNAWRFPEQAALIHALLQRDSQVALIIVGDPLDKTLFPEARVVLTTFSPIPVSLQSALKFLF